MTFIIGITGSIGMGKSAAAALFRQLGIPVFDADKCVHSLLSRGGIAVRHVARVFPFALRAGKIDRNILGDIVFFSASKLKKLEKIIHPLVFIEVKKFLTKSIEDKTPLVVLDIPLLFEGGYDEVCDLTLCVTALNSIQRLRVMRRKGMTQKKINAIISRQMPDKIKRKKADKIIHSFGSFIATRDEIAKILSEFLKLPSTT